MPTAPEEYYETLTLIAAEDATASLSARYLTLRNLLDRLCMECLGDERLRITDLSARINLVASKYELTTGEQNRLHTFRLTSNAILNHAQAPDGDKLLRDVKTVAFFVKRITGHDIPPRLYARLPRADATYVPLAPGVSRRERMRVIFRHADAQYLYCGWPDGMRDDLVRVRHNVPQVNDEFAGTVDRLWPFAQLNLLDVTEDADGNFVPAFIVLEPDYLMDISSLAECFREYGHHPANYQLARLRQPQNTRPLLLGNIANLFLDEWINTPQTVSYAAAMKKVFQRHALELAACPELTNRECEQVFAADCRLHFNNIGTTVQQTFHDPGYNLDRTRSVLEPSFVCEPLGLQGRMDYLQIDGSALIEMKSGKADEYLMRPRITAKENHLAQMLLYQAVIEYTLGRNHRDVDIYLLYTRYPLLYPARSSWAMVRRIIDLRNRIVADEYSLQRANTPDFTALKLTEISPAVLNERKLTGKLWTNYLAPDIEKLSNNLHKLDETAQRYFYALYTFVVRELYTTRLGNDQDEARRGAAAMWLSTFDEKCAAGEILFDLQIQENHADDELRPTIRFGCNFAAGRADEEIVPLPNFRQGDAVLLYVRNTAQDTAVNRMVFKATLEQLTADAVQVRLRAVQKNLDVLPADARYALEHDSLEGAGSRSQFAGLSLFLTVNADRRDLLMGKRLPRFDQSLDADIAAVPDADPIARIVLKARAARDYFLLVGPPGTGKTSQALRRMVEDYYADGNSQILLMAYTNRAVDEICRALSRICPAVEFIRVGAETSCDEAYRPRLLESVLAACSTRTQVRQVIADCRVFVGTVSTMSGKHDLFRLKQFDVAIIDEATQILEPQLLGLLCTQTPEGRNGIERFILIGDHRQLPAVVVQPADETAISDPLLLEAGISNLRNSLFERLYRRLQSAAPAHISARAIDFLARQGRMHPDVAEFSNRAFYGGRLETLGLLHQTNSDVAPLPFGGAMHLTSRVIFVPSERDKSILSGKVNASEARLAAQLAEVIYNEHKDEFDADQTLGIITPYRHQIAFIRRQIEQLGLSALCNLTVDTVERFQGSERDIIIYSFCANHRYQLRTLSNVVQIEGCDVDRKLNVALTRARKRLYLIGVPAILEIDNIYSQLLNLKKQTLFCTNLYEY